MGITVSGAGSAGAQPAMAGTLTIKNTNDARARTAELGGRSSKAKKQLNYNHREISGQLLRSKKVQGAAAVLTRARSKVSMLQRCAATGQYDQGEMANAIAHARRMVQCAQQKTQNLREEEQQQKKHRTEADAREQQKQSEVKRRVAQKERQLKSKVFIDQMQEASREKQRSEEMQRKRRMHRSEERSKVCEADMKYIKAQVEDDKYATSYFCENSGIAVDISTTAVAMNELQILEQQVQQEALTQADAEIMAQVTAPTVSERAAAPAVAGTATPVDVSI